MAKKYEVQTQDTYAEISAHNARARHPDWDEVCANHPWTEEQSERVRTYDGDKAQLCYEIAKENEWKPPSDTEIYGDGDDGSDKGSPEPAGVSEESLYDGR